LSDLSPLEPLGYSPRWRAAFAAVAKDGLVPARVLRVDRGGVVVAAPAGVLRARSAARLLKNAGGNRDLPAVGDWVALHAADDLDIPLVEVVLERDSAITRGDPGKTADVQVLAANVDTVFVVHPLATAPNLRRIERELSLAWDSGAVPVVVLAKSDLSADAEAALEAVAAIAPGVDVLLTSGLTGQGVEQLSAYIRGHRTAVFIGPSGAGKSTLVNALMGEERQAIREVRVKDGRGRHATVARELIPVSGGGVLIDTPGLRALALTGSEEGIGAVFADVEQLASSCRFRDCTHTAEPGCAVLAAVRTGALSEERLAGYHKLLREARAMAMKTDARLRQAEVRKWKIRYKEVREHYKQTGRE